MARIRSIHPGLFTDEAFMQLTVEAPLAVPLLIGLWTEADDRGVFLLRALTIKARILPAAQADIGELLGALERLNFIRRFRVGEREFGAVRNFCKFQRPKKPKYLYPLPHDLHLYVGSGGTGSELSGNDDLTSSEPESDERGASSEPVPPSDPQSSEPVGNRFGTGGEKSPQIGGGRREKEEEKKISSDFGSKAPAELELPDLALAAGQADPDPPGPKPRRRSTDEEPDGFAEFYAAYPRKDARQAAAKAFPVAIRAAGGLNPLMEGLRRYRFSDEPKFVPMAATWLNGRRWQDQGVPAVPDPAPTRRYDPRYFDRPPAEVRSLPKPRPGSAEFDAWDRAIDGFITPAPDKPGSGVRTPL
ncbi:MAG TPA: hypothetical protein VNS22_01895 [Geminicoccus sp.]|uniref:hypothetical protein n=1 Tax=Geminicoccus sp. TaxID=2024832 RepID=UPI002CBB90F3|nr:hypothetical protein [Geminicoccus sp.]HWL67115.1 hypothetical protein [Geminicoccus sp.]